MWAKSALRVPGDVTTLDDIAFNASGRDDEDDSGDDCDDDVDVYDDECDDDDDDNDHVHLEERTYSRHLNGQNCYK